MQDLKSAIKPYERSILTASLFQLLSSAGLFVGACVLMYWSLKLSYVLTVLLAVPTGALLVRIFIIQHDCGHGSFFKRRWANNVVGTLCSVLTLVPLTLRSSLSAIGLALWDEDRQRLVRFKDVSSTAIR